MLPHFEDEEKFIILNFSSFNERYPKVNLVPPIDMGGQWNDEVEFDNWYFNWILSNNGIFIEFMKIVYPLYAGFNVFVLINWFDLGDFYFYANLNESLMKLIQIRYGYNASIVNTIEDYYSLSSYQLESAFSEEGIRNLDYDKGRMAYVLQDHFMSTKEQIPIIGFKYAVEEN